MSVLDRLRQGLLCRLNWNVVVVITFIAGQDVTALCVHSSVIKLVLEVLFLSILCLSFFNISVSTELECLANLCRVDWQVRLEWLDSMTILSCHSQFSSWQDCIVDP